jgi:thioester reductase-like protein
MTNRLNLSAEADLETAIRFDNPLSEFVQSPTAIFLTGATGFFGAYLLNELLHKTTADIYCLIRCKEGSALGKQRIEDHLRAYLLWKGEFTARIIPVIGDLSLPLYGLSNQQFSELAARIDIIYHNGAWVNAAYPYSALQATNVGGTVETLRLAGLHHTKPVHFVSTVAVFFHDSCTRSDSKIRETDSAPPNLNGGYKQSKWVAEHLVMKAQQRGLPACIYRTTRIMGHSKTGITQNFNDFLISMIKMCIQVGKFPDWNSTLSLVPADYAAEALVYLAQQPASIGKTFHILNPHAIAWDDFFAQIRDCGYPLEKVAYSCWQTAIQAYAHENQDSKLYSLARLVLKSSTAMSYAKPEFDMSQTLTGLSDSTINCPPVDRKLVSTWISYFQQCGHIPLPFIVNT